MNTAAEILVTTAFPGRTLDALIFGRAADRYGRRQTLMVDMPLDAVMGFVAGFASSLTTPLLIRSCSAPPSAARGA